MYYASRNGYVLLKKEMTFEQAISEAKSLLRRSPDEKVAIVKVIAVVEHDDPPVKVRMLDEVSR